MEECDILGEEVKTYSDPLLHIFKWSGLPQPPGSTLLWTYR